ncbi:cell division protein FtsL [Rhizobium panacihumi]|uniref:cell division protein FtsL n=1 Tax=Rhizobium panacihumi TaxID=2008450 RepID=UPI003D79756A
MLRSFDIVLIGVMTATAVVTYTIKHRAELKLEEVRRLQTEIRLERDTIDLLKADWALQTQPSRLQHLIGAYNQELQLAATDPTQLAQPNELPMLKSQLPQPETSIEQLIAGADDEVAKAIRGVAAAKASPPASRIPVPVARGSVRVDSISTGSVNR